MPHRRTSLYACLRFVDGSKWCNKEHPYKPYIFVNCMTDSWSIKCGLQYIRNYQLWKAKSSILFYYMNYKENYLFWKRQRSTTFLVSIRPILPRARFRRKQHLHIGNCTNSTYFMIVLFLHRRASLLYHSGSFSLPCSLSHTARLTLYKHKYDA